MQQHKIQNFVFFALTNTSLCIIINADDTRLCII
nr:MAG TPA: hypothetical protein [Caudoviricetes sp.]